MLQSGYSWDGSTAEPCDDKYRLGKVEVQDEELIVCNDCPTGTSYDGYNGCVLNTGYSWSDTTERTDTLYNDPIKDNIAYYYSGDEATGCTIGHYNDYNTVYNDCTQCPDDEGIDCSTNRPFVNANMILQPNYSWISGTAQQCDNYNIRHNIQEITNIGDITCEPCELNEYKYDLTCKPIPPRHYKKSDGDITEVPANRISSGNIALTDIIVNQIILEYTSDSLDTIPTINLTYQDITTNLITNNLISIDTDLINKKIYYDINTYYIKIKDIQDISIDNDEIIITKIIAKTNDGNYYLLAEPQLETFTNYNLEGFTDGQRSIYNKQTLYENTTQKSCPLGTYVNADANVCQYPKDGQILSGNTAQDCPIGSIVKDEGLFDNRDCGYAISGYYTKDKNTYYPCAGDEYQDLERQDTCKPEPGYDTDNISSRPYTFITNNGVNIGVELNRGYSYDYTTKNITECPLDYYREEKTVINNETDITCTPCGPNQITFTKASTSEDNCKDECLVDYYFNNNDNECQTCGPFGNGIECPGGDLIDEAHRYLKAGYKWTGTESELCDPGYYRGNDTTQGPIVYDGTEIPCDGCPTGYSINYTPSSDNLIKSIGECLYDVCEDDEYRDDSNVCQSISPQDCTGDQIHFLGIAENNDTNYPDEHITYDDITAETYQSYDSTCYPGQDAKYFVADDTYSPYFETFAV